MLARVKPKNGFRPNSVSSSSVGMQEDHLDAEIDRYLLNGSDRAASNPPAIEFHSKTERSRLGVGKWESCIN